MTPESKPPRIKKADFATAFAFYKGFWRWQLCASALICRRDCPLLAQNGNYRFVDSGGFQRARTEAINHEQQD